jgi:hypothetical protein
MREEDICVTDFSLQYIMAFLARNLHFLLMKPDSIWVGISVIRIGTGAVLIWERRLSTTEQP